MHASIRNLGLVILCCIAWLTPALAVEEEQTLEQLKTAIEKLVKRKQLPSVSVAVVDATGIQMLESFGLANIEKKIPATPDSLYRIGSTSKMFVALAVLKLVQEGRLSLDDTLRSLAPEIQFTNPWEDSHPVKVVHLLEHTTGWDDMHIVEYAHNLSTPIELKAALDFHPHSRESRWAPGTRMAYCNSGPPVAAYIVEKISGQTFEDYVEENFFDPLGMSGATYFYDEAVKEKGVNLYNEKNEPEKYWHILLRPSGAINASITDMAHFLQFFINRGEINGEQIISEESLLRMERPGDHLGAREGLELGYGLNNYSSTFESWHYREHNGAVNNGLSAFAYLPQIRAGYAVLMNSGHAAVQQEIVNLIRKFQTQNLEKPVVEKERELTDEQRSWEGRYVAINPRVQMSYAFVRLMAIFSVSFEDDKMRIQPLVGDWTAYHYPVSDTLFKSDYTGAMHVALVEDPVAGRVIHMETAVMQPISAFWVYFRLLVLVLWTIIVVSSFVYFLVWLVLKTHDHPTANINLQIHLWPLLASSCVVLTFVLNMIGMRNIFAHFGSPGVISIGMMTSTFGFAVFSFLALITVIRQRNSGLNRMLYFYFALASLLHVSIAIYLLRFGLVGIVTWA